MSLSEEQVVDAASVASALVIKARAHVTVSLKSFSGILQKASASSPHGVDRAAAQTGAHKLATSARIAHVESASNALEMHLRGLEVILREDVFYPLPAIAVARAIAETVAACTWLLQTDDPDERAARAYAAIFKDLEKTVTQVAEHERFAGIREQLVNQIEASGVRVQRRTREGQLTDDVDVIHVSRAHARTGYSYSQRVSDQIPAIATTYSAMSGVVHGTQSTVASALDNPATFARLIAVVSIKSVEVWSQCVHGWVGATPPRFYTDGDYEALVNTIPQTLRDELRASS